MTDETKKKTTAVTIAKAETSMKLQHKHVGVLPDMQAIDTFVDSVINSSMAKNFETKDSDGIRSIERGDIVAAIILGAEMDISPAGALILGRKLNAKSYFSVRKGKAMGMDPISAINNIHNISTSSGDVLSIGVNAINMCLMRGGVQVDFIKDYSPTPIYRDAYTNRYVGYHEQLFPTDKVSSAFVFDEKTHTKDDVKAARSEGKVIVVSTKEFTYVTIVKFYRHSNNMTITIPYSIQDAIDAELCQGYHSTLINKDGTAFYVKGKSNWNQNMAIMLRNRPISIGGRIIVGDLLQGGYSHDEVVDMVNTQEGTDYKNIEEVKEAKIVS